MKPRIPGQGAAWSVQRRVEEEFGRPFWEVVRGFAEDGESASATARILGYASHSPFLRLLKRHNAQGLFLPPTETNGALSAHASTRGVQYPRKIAALEQARKKCPGYRWIVIGEVRDTIAGHARRRGLNPRAVYRRTAKGKTLKEALHLAAWEVVHEPN